ncbi:hypothetical protein, partial [Bradyrhizobium sp. NAS96.2]|uniref:hypothetical protein n=1 Tax=Bradyrhizobium sp. NAS96.2 TaxID=1680160 RepID=UPI001AEC8004
RWNRCISPRLHVQQMRHLSFMSAIVRDFGRMQKHCACVSSRDDVNDCVVASMQMRNCIIVGHQFASRAVIRSAPTANHGSSVV